MIELSWNGHILPEEIAGRSSTELEEIIEEKIAKGLTHEMTKHIEEMSFLDMKSGEDGSVNIKAELVLCSKNDIVTSVQRQSVILAQYGLTEKQILTVLETSVEKSEGF